MSAGTDYGAGAVDESRSDVFQKIYEHNWWGSSESRSGPDVAPNFYPAAIGVWPSVMPGWAAMAAVRGAEPSVERSAADRRAAA